MVMACAVSADIYEEYKCPVCLNFFVEPTRTSCSHVFCKLCLDQSKNTNTVCPQCRQDYQGEIIPARDIKKRMDINSYSCACGYQSKLKDARTHEQSCNLANRIPTAKTTPGLGLKLAPNRYTFPCAYCNQQNLDRETLLTHCNELHRDAPNHRRVCTICTAYPWGDPNQISENLLDHLNRRHSFEYDRFVDFTMDDDEALRQALTVSQEWYTPYECSS